MNHSLEYLSLIAAIIVAISGNFILPSNGQMEFCHWDCILIGCDYYGDCDYDCYEICDIWRGQPNLANRPTTELASESQPASRDVKTPTGSSKHELPASSKKPNVMMRIKGQNSTGLVESSRRMAIWNQCEPTKKSTRSLGRKSLPLGHKF